MKQKINSKIDNTSKYQLNFRFRNLLLQSINMDIMLLITPSDIEEIFKLNPISSNFTRLVSTEIFDRLKYSDMFEYESISIMKYQIIKIKHFFPYLKPID